MAAARAMEKIRECGGPWLDRGRRVIGDTPLDWHRRSVRRSIVAVATGGYDVDGSARPADVVLQDFSDSAKFLRALQLAI